ncbi:CAMK/CAMK1 protein kinase, variant 1 [Aphanomyces invadans]|uniref:non-specific serine/threonine protein kinase n=1 Tax=Aphanomyces invadans TaxID=157072 RepID=A0A024UKS5_9STRA|nr:CAMK/CAMK1 protein kinase, variant 1 [Aphanomyces invadans]ETW06233.1 CAMK/CAMK1 protein kinase, variant 1 [Aphanomyces invadans]|eukprot:XP_008864308.1 CAMK/CAMK1 protein kinase, variant 1 [Aphanomyces invadans]
MQLPRSHYPAPRTFPDPTFLAVVRDRHVVVGGTRAIPRFQWHTKTKIKIGDCNKMGCVKSSPIPQVPAAPNAAAAPATTGATGAPSTELVTNEPQRHGFEANYTLGKKLGEGTFSVVKEGIQKATGKKFAIKCIKKSGLSQEDLDALHEEIDILKKMEHPNIMTLFEVYTEAQYYYLVTEFMEGGELFDRIVEKTFYTEKEARDLVQVLLGAIKYCHDQNVVHRDLKPENLLLTSKDDDAYIKIGDFGFAKQDMKAGLTTACGTPGYVAPEILKGESYGKSVDIWSIGVITFILLCGYPPFHDENQKRLFTAIKLGQYKFDSPYWDDVSADAKDFISKMLIVNPAERFTADQLLQHVWVTGDDVSTVPLTKAMEELKKYNTRRKFKAAVRTVQVTAALTRGLAPGSHGKDDDPEGADDESEAVDADDVKVHVDPVEARAAPVDEAKP